MTLINRISRLFRADFHAVLDRLEQPDILLRQALREMEEETLLDEQRENRLKQELERQRVRRGELEQTLESVAEELDICFAAGREPLARGLIRRRLEIERRQEDLNRRTESLKKALDDLRGRLHDQNIRLEALRQKAALLDEEDREEIISGGDPATATPIGEDDIEIAFLREKQRRLAL